MATQIGPKIGIEGEKEYREQLNKITQQAKTLDSEMKKVTSTFDKNTSELRKNKTEAQNTQQKIGMLSEKQEILNKLLQEASEKFGESSNQAQSYQRSVNNIEAEINKLNTKMQSFGGAEKFSEISTKMADVGTKMQNIGQSMVSVGQKLTMSLTLPIAAAGAAAVKLGSDLEESSNKVDVVFGNMSQAVKDFADNALNSYGLAEGSALQMAGTFGAMATSMGMSQKEAANMSISLTELAADMASFYNVSTDVAQTSLQGIFTGETEALKKFGIVMTQTNLEKFAADQGKVYKSMTESEKVMTRYAYVMEATKDAQGDFARTSDGTANSLRVFQESLKELGAAFGEQLLPIITPIIQALTRIIQTISNLPAPVQKVITVVALVVACIGPLILIIGTLMSSLGSIVTNAPLIISALSNIGAAAASMGGALAAAAPEILLVVAALAVIAGVTYEIVTHWDEISAAAQNMAAKVKSAFNKLLDLNEQLKNRVNGIAADIVSALVSLPGKIVDALREGVQKVRDIFDQMISKAKQSGKDFIQGFVDGIKEKLSKVVDACKKVADTVKDYLGFSCPDKGPLSEYETWMPDFMQGLAKGIKSNIGLVRSAVNDVAKTMALPLDANASMNMALAGAGSDSSSVFGGTVMNINVDHISELNDLIRIQNQAQQMYRMGAR